MFAAEDILLNGLTPGWFVPSEPDPANVTGEERGCDKEKRGQDQFLFQLTYGLTELHPCRLPSRILTPYSPPCLALPLCSGRAEVLQHAVHHKVPVLAVVDPPRDGLHGDCIRYHPPPTHSATSPDSADALTPLQGP